MSAREGRFAFFFLCILFLSSSFFFSSFRCSSSFSSLSFHLALRLSLRAIVTAGMKMLSLLLSLVIVLAERW